MLYFNLPNFKTLRSLEHGISTACKKCLSPSLSPPKQTEPQCFRESWASVICTNHLLILAMWIDSWSDICYSSHNGSCLSNSISVSHEFNTCSIIRRFALTFTAELFSNFLFILTYPPFHLGTEGGLVKRQKYSTNFSLAHCGLTRWC